MADTKAHQRYRSKVIMQKNGLGKILPGVTTVIDGNLGWNKRILMAWSRKTALAGEDPDAVRDEAGISGTCAHLMVECHIKGIQPDLSNFTPCQVEKAENGFLAFLDWEQGQQGLKYGRLEFGVVSEEWAYGGTVDIEAFSGDDLWMIDLKTSKGLYPEMKIQVAAYAKAYEEQEGRKIDQCHLLQLNKEDGAFHHYTIPNDTIEAAWEVFKRLRELHGMKKGLA